MTGLIKPKAFNPERSFGLRHGLGHKTHCQGSLIVGEGGNIMVGSPTKLSCTVLPYIARSNNSLFSSQEIFFIYIFNELYRSNRICDMIAGEVYSGSVAH